MRCLFDRPHHRLVADVLSRLDGDLLADHSCWFGGGTAIALSCGEYRESVDIDFLVSDPTSYRALRQLVRSHGLAVLAGGELELVRAARVDNYGIRAVVRASEVPIKFEIIHEGLKMRATRAEVWQRIRSVASACAALDVLRSEQSDLT